ncbi:MAG: iron ABC transporter substrate-binding protein [Trueperaceae bacterium]
MIKKFSLLLSALLLLGGALAQTLTVYSGRNEAFVGPVIAAFEQETGVEVEVRYGGTAQLAAQILEEGRNSPADVFLAQDAGALGALEEAELFATLDEGILDLVEPRFRSDSGAWVGVTGRARVLVGSPDAQDVPSSVFELVDEQYSGRLGWAPTNASFQAFVTAMRVRYGNELTREWLRGMIVNEVNVYPNNTSIVDAVGRGEIDYGLVNHYYLFRFLAEDPNFPAQNYFLEDADIGGLVNVAGAGVLATSDNRELAGRFVEYLLGEDAQRHFSDEVSEYPLAQGIEARSELPSLDELETPNVDLSDLADLEGTLELLQETGALE